MSHTIAVIITTHNEENTITGCVESARLLTDTIIVIDMESTDATVKNAQLAGATVFSHPHTMYVEPSREFAIGQAQTDWVFILDADERITHQLAEEIKKQVQISHCTHFAVPRKNIFGRKVWFKHGGWWPDNQMRLIRKDAFNGWPKQIHSTPMIDGEKGTLTNPFLHYFHGDIQAMVNKTALYEDIESELLYTAGRDVSVPILFRKFFGELYRRLIRNKGFLDGKIGILESVYQAYSKTITYLFLYEKKKSRSV